MTPFKSAREKYKPDKIRYLLIAEAPPKLESGRFFYFEDVQKGDSLFLEVMKVLYDIDVKSARKDKPKLLKRFMEEGFYLEDSVDMPIEAGQNKENVIKKNLPTLMVKAKRLVDENTRIILIVSTVYRVCYQSLKNAGFNVINEEALPFPGSGQQVKFREKFLKLLQKEEIR